MSAEERLGDDAHRVLRSARWWARHLGSDIVDERHLLIGVVSVDDSELRFQLHGLRMSTHSVVSAMGVPQNGDDLDAVLPADDVAAPLSPTAEQILRVALGESVKLDHDDIRPAHLMLALLQEGGVLLDVVLESLGVDRAALLREVRDLLGTTGVARSVLSASLGGVRSSRADPSVRGWTTPRCHSCQNVLADNAQLSTMLFEDTTAGEQIAFRVLWCTACGTSMAIERVRPDADGRPVA